MSPKIFIRLMVLVVLSLGLFIQSCDNNSSEGLNSEERQALIDSFLATDDDTNEGLSPEEVLEELDPTADGKVIEEELTQFHDNFSLDGLSQRDLANIRKAFESSDANIDMSLSENEIFRIMDENKDGEISKEELIDFHELVARSPNAVPEQFLMPIDEVFSIVGRGTVVTGAVERGKLYAGDEVEVVGFTETFTTTAISVEITGSEVSQRASAGVGQSAGILLRGVDPEEVQRGQVLATPGSVKAGQKFKVDISLLTKEEGGRAAPIFTSYNPDFILRTARLSGIVTLPPELEILFPGESAENVGIELSSPVAIEKNFSFDINEGGNKVGSGVITEILDN